MSALRKFIDPWLVLILIFAGVALFSRLDQRPFWQDEAETACLARNLKSRGVPVASDGLNTISQEENREFKSDSIWRWSPWLQIYIAAGSFRIFGLNTWAGRFPFAICGLLTILMVYLLVRRASGHIAWARLSAAFMACSVPFLLHARQCRYYATGALLCSIALFALRRTSWRSLIFAVVMLAALFYLNYIVFIASMFGLILGSVALERGRFSHRQLAVGGVALLALIAPGLWFYRVGSAAGLLDVSVVLRNLGRSTLGTLQFILPLPVIVVLAWHGFRKRAEMPADERYVLALLVMVIGNVIALALTPNFFFRYLIHLIPAASVILGWCVFRLWSWHKLSAVMFALIVGLTNWLNLAPLQWTGLNLTPWYSDGSTLAQPNIPLQLFWTELRNGYPDVNEGLIEYLNENAQAGDTVLVSYGDLPLQFYTELRVVGGFQRMAPGTLPLHPNWVVSRRRTFLNRDNKLPTSVRYIDSMKLERDYVPIPLDVPDEPFGNRTDPYYHRFYPPAEPYQRALLYRRKDS